MYLVGGAMLFEELLILLCDRDRSKVGSDSKTGLQMDNGQRSGDGGGEESGSVLIVMTSA